MKNIFSKKDRTLLMELVRTDFKLRYQGSVLGYTWSLLRPLLLFCILYIVFVKFLKLGKDVSHFPVYLLLGIVLWNFFTEMTSMSLSSVVVRGDLIRKIRIPRWIIVLSSSVSALINLGLNLLVVFVFAVLNGVEFRPQGAWLLVILAEIYIFSLGISFFLSAAYVKYRDVSYIWEVVLQGAFYITPILYPVSIVTNLYFQKILLINPMAQAIQDARNVIVTTDALTIGEVYNTQLIRIVPLILSTLLFITGVLYFKKESKTFAENL